MQQLHAPASAYSAHGATNLTRGRTYTLLARRIDRRAHLAEGWPLVGALRTLQMGRAAEQSYLLANLVSDPGGGGGARQQPIRGYFLSAHIFGALIRSSRAAAAGACANPKPGGGGGGKFIGTSIKHASLCRR